jgi:hypothetical protein
MSNTNVIRFWTKMATAAAADSGTIDPFGFLGIGPFRSENPDYEGWISLNFLGFSRPNLDLSIGHAE